MIRDDEQQHATLALIAILCAHGRYRHPPCYPNTANAGAVMPPPLPLHAAVLKRRDRVVRALVVDLGAKVDAPFPGPLRESSLAIAVQLRSAPIVEALLRCGADPGLPDTTQRTPLAKSLAQCVRGEGARQGAPTSAVAAKCRQLLASIRAALRSEVVRHLPLVIAAAILRPLDKAEASRCEEQAVRYLLLAAPGGLTEPSRLGDNTVQSKCGSNGGHTDTSFTKWNLGRIRAALEALRPESCIADARARTECIANSRALRDEVALVGYREAEEARVVAEVRRELRLRSGGKKQQQLLEAASASEARVVC